MAKIVPILSVVLLIGGIFSPVLHGKPTEEESEITKTDSESDIIVSKKTDVDFEGWCDANNTCDTTKSLSCSSRGKCECTEEESMLLHYSTTLLKCVEEIDMSQETDKENWEKENISDNHSDNMEENISDVLDMDDSDDAKENKQDIESEAESDVHVGHDEMDMVKPKQEGDDPVKDVILGAGVGGFIGAPTPCTANGDCQAGTFGRYSRCGTSGHCECHDETRQTVLFNRACYLKRTIGDVCESHVECHATIAGKAWCATVDMSRRICQCELYHYWDASLKECLPFARKGLDSPCKKNYQCTAAEALGNLSRCTGEKCECFDTINEETERKPIIYYAETLSCFFEVDLMSHCTDDAQCEASLGAEAVCASHPEYLPNDRICQCEEGKQCGKKDEGRPGMSTFTMIVFIVAGVVMLVGIVLCFVLRKNDRYDVVSQSPR